MYLCIYTFVDEGACMCAWLCSYTLVSLYSYTLMSLCSYTLIGLYSYTLIGICGCGVVWLCALMEYSACGWGLALAHTGAFYSRALYSFMVYCALCSASLWVYKTKQIAPWLWLPWGYCVWVVLLGNVVFQVLRDSIINGAAFNVVHVTPLPVLVE